MERKNETLYFVYGMRLRGFAIGCQPMNGLFAHKDGNGKYYDILYYVRRLTDEEVRNYELDYLGVSSYGN